MSVKFGLPPIARPDARLFVLGSLPGDASLAAKRYYAHPTNQFWRLLGQAIGEELQALDYPIRLTRLAERRIGLWDVIASANRSGSLDHAIRARLVSAVPSVKPAELARNTRPISPNKVCVCCASAGSVGPIRAVLRPR